MTVRYVIHAPPRSMGASPICSPKSERKKGGLNISMFTEGGMGQPHGDRLGGATDGGASPMTLQLSKPIGMGCVELGMRFRLESTIPPHVVIVAVAEGSIAGRCGLRTGDIVLEIAGVAVSGVAHATRLLDQAVPVSLVNLVIERTPR